MSKNVFVVGLDPFNLELLEHVRGAAEYRFIELLSYEEAIHPKSGRLDFESLLNEAEARLDAFSGSIDAIFAYWDFPISALVPTLCRSHGLPGPTLEAVAACEHKYWSRLEQSHVVPDLIPDFCAVDPFDENAASHIRLDFPFWLKPIKAHSSYLGFKIDGQDDLVHALAEIRAGIGRFANAFDSFLSRVQMPKHISGIGGKYCIAEEIISSGRQCTLEGYAFDGHVEVYGVVDSLRTGAVQSSFSRYQYPSTLPRSVQQRMIDAAGKVMLQFAYDGAPFNMEFYWDEDDDRISLLEVNARLSKSHAPLFALVDGASHQQIAVELALGRKPEFAQRQGEYAMAAKFMVRVPDKSGWVRRLPRDDELAAARNEFPELRYRLLTEEGDDLTELHYQDSYTSELAELFLGGANEEDLLRKYRRCMQLLTFEIEGERLTQ